MKKEHYGWKPLFSVLSLLVLLFLMCAIVLFILIRTGVMNIDWLFTGSTDSAKETEGDSLVISGMDPDSADLTEENIRTILKDTPFYNTFYARVYSTYVGNYDGEDSESYIRYESYDIYKWNDMYKILTYNRYMNVVKTVVCDGKHILFTDNETGESHVYAVGDIYSFENQAPIPDFSAFETGNYEIESYEMKDGICSVVCKMSGIDVTDEIEINMENGMITYFKTTSKFGNGSYSYGYSLGDYTIGSNKGTAFANQDFVIG